ncbi:MAG: hypothetical protein IJO40_11825 [Thermoguttaceae bacterium]|nr:hypothetical protein [Thermoguttaceae bacterium]
MRRSSRRPFSSSRRLATLALLLAPGFVAAPTAFELPAFADEAPAVAPDFKPEYPNDPPLDAVPREIAEYRSFVVFDFAAPDATADGWASGPNAKIAGIADGVLKVRATGDDPYFFTPMLNEIKFNADGSPRTVSGTTLVRLRMRTTTTGGGQFFTAETAFPEYDESRAPRFPLATDGEFNDYLVPVETVSPLLRLRLDPGNDAGEIEIARLELIEVVYKPVKFGVSTVADGKLTFELKNGAPTPTRLKLDYLGVDPVKSSPGAHVEIADDAPIDLYYPKKAPFETLEVVGTQPVSKERITRRFFAFHEDVADAKAADAAYVASAPTLKNDRLEVRFSPDASGAEIFRSGKRVAVLTPLLVEDGDGAKTVPTEHTDAGIDAALAASDAEKAAPKANAPSRLRPVFRSLDAEKAEVEFALTDASDAVCGSLRFRLDGDVLAFSADAPRPVHSPVVRVLGPMKQAILAGVEHLETGEHSSSTADLETPEHIRFAPPVLWLTSPFMSVVSERCAAALLFDDPSARSIFAVPNFLDGDANSSRFNVCAPKVSGKIRIAAPDEAIEESVLWSVLERGGLPELPKRPRSTAEQEALHLAGFEKSRLKMEGGWAHAVGSGLPPFPFDPHYGSDFVSTIWELTGALPETPRLDVGGGHIRNYVSFLLSGKADLFLRWINDEAANIRKAQRPDGSFRYSGKFLRGHWVDYASGDCGNYLFRLLEHWRLTGDKESLNAALKGLAFVNELKTPRGAQVWELSLHTPDIMGASRCVLANVWAFEATGDRRYLDAARRWALSGVPYVYLWERRPLAGNDDPVMLYATTPVFGATGWIAPNWIGLPVQWCGLDYAYALLLLAPHDSTLDWRKLAEGIVISAEEQVYPDGPFVGLLPDSFNLAAQLRVPYNINPCVVHMLRRLLDGRPTNVSVVDVAGRRVVSPFPARAEGSTLKIDAPAGTTYQIVVDGKEIREMKSQGADVVSFAAPERPLQTVADLNDRR